MRRACSPPCRTFQNEPRSSLEIQKSAFLTKSPLAQPCNNCMASIMNSRQSRMDVQDGDRHRGGEAHKGDNPKVILEDCGKPSSATLWGCNEGL
jgi:hypothetical protein